MAWTTRSPHLNSIKHMWIIFGRRSKNPNNLEDVERLLIEEFGKNEI